MKRIALAQMNIEYGNFEKNVSSARLFIQNAVDAHCNLILLPELWSSGFDLHSCEKYALQNPSLISELQSISDEKHLTICGSFIEKVDGNFFNAFKTIQPHSSIVSYHKKHLFHLMREDKYFSPGDDPQPFTTILGLTGMSVCFDLRFPELFRNLSAQGVQSYLLSSHWPLVRINHWVILLQARAIENQAFMIAANSVGVSGKDAYGGHSAVIAPDGEILCRASENEEELLCVDIDPMLVDLIREKFLIRR